MKTVEIAGVKMSMAAAQNVEESGLNVAEDIAREMRESNE